MNLTPAQQAAKEWAEREAASCTETAKIISDDGYDSDNIWAQAATHLRTLIAALDELDQANRALGPRPMTRNL